MNLRSLVAVLMAALSVTSTYAYADRVSLKGVITNGSPVASSGSLIVEAVSMETGEQYQVHIIGTLQDEPATELQQCGSRPRALLVKGAKIQVIGEREGSKITAASLRCVAGAVTPPPAKQGVTRTYTGRAKCSHLLTFVSQERQTNPTDDICIVGVHLTAQSRNGQYGHISIESYLETGDSETPDSQFVGKYLRQGNRVLFNFGIHAEYPREDGASYPYADFVNGQLIIKATTRDIIRLTLSESPVPS